jgi:hypothetical protein
VTSPQDSPKPFDDSTKSGSSNECMHEKHRSPQFLLIIGVPITMITAFQIPGVVTAAVVAVVVVVGPARTKLEIIFLHTTAVLITVGGAGVMPVMGGMAKMNASMKSIGHLNSYSSSFRGSGCSSSWTWHYLSPSRSIPRSSSRGSKGKWWLTHSELWARSQPLSYSTRWLIHCSRKLGSGG